jgi:ribonuclease P/MRP protein subunit POP1
MILLTGFLCLQMIEDNTPTVTARRRKPTQHMRIRLETARRLQNLNSRTKAKRVLSRGKQEKESRKLLEDAGSHAFSVAPRVPKIKKNKLSRPPPPDSKYKKRQRGKTWLPTHVFHAKRAHMASSNEPLWRFAVPLSPTEKSYRPTHRASTNRGAIAWDVSYMSTIRLEGTGPALESVLRSVGVDGDEAWGAKGKKWRAGTRSLQAWVFQRDGQRGPIAPVTLIWRAEEKSSDVEMVDAGDGGARKANKKNRRSLLLRIHPSAFLQLWNELLEVSKRQNPPVMVEDLRFEIGSIEITGPGSAEALISTLQPLMADGNPSPTDSPEATWSSLPGVANSASLPKDALLAFSISDPRLRFPQKTVKTPSSDTHMNDLAILLSTWPPDRTQAPSSLFDRPARLAAARQLPSQKAINRRRTAAGPGTYPPAQTSDPHIPVIILASRPRAKNDNLLGSWTVLLPWKCVLPVWYSLMYYPLSSGGNPRFGGLKEQQQLMFEAGEPWFPGDFPGTQAGWEWGLREREQAKQEWERRPKGRRVEFDSLDLGTGQKGEIGRGWACDWERLVQGPPKDSGQEDSKETEGNKDPESADTSLPLNIRQLPKAAAEAAINNPVSSSTPSLATVRISLSSRGTPSARARIYRLPSADAELRQKWLSLETSQPGKQPQSQTDPASLNEEARRRLAASLISPPSNPDPAQEHPPPPPEADLIGFVTTGNYNLSEGRATGIGSILVSKVSGGVQGKKGQRTMCIIRAAGEKVGRLGYWEVV